MDNNFNAKNSSEEARNGNTSKVILPSQAIQSGLEKWMAKNRSLVLRQTPFWAQSIAGTLVSVGLITVLGGIFFKIDEVVTVYGQLEPIYGSTQVKTPVGGKVSQSFFKDGISVRKGQLLIRFDTRQASDEKNAMLRLISLENEEKMSQLTILKAKKSVIEKKLDTTDRILKELKLLVSSGGFQKMQYLQQLDERYELQSQLSSLSSEMQSISLNSNKAIRQLQSKLQQADLQLQYQNVAAPIDGIIFEPKARVDGVLQAGETILTIVPQKGLKAQVYVPNKDIGFVRTGQTAKVRVDAFPFTRYGELKGKIIQIGADALPPDQSSNFYRFPVKLQLDRSYLSVLGTKIPLRSGMAITANLKLREKRVITLLSDMLVNQTESLKSIRQ